MRARARVCVRLRVVWCGAGSGTPPVSSRRSTALTGSPARPVRYEEMVGRPDVYPDNEDRKKRERTARRLALRRELAEAKVREQHDRLKLGAESLSVSTKGSAALVAPKYGAPPLPAEKPPSTEKKRPNVSDAARRRMLDTGRYFQPVSQTPPPHAPVPETSMRLVKTRREEDGAEFIEVRLSELTRKLGAQPASVGGVPMRLIEKNCRDGNSDGPAPVVYSPGPGAYKPSYTSPNKTDIGVTAEKIEQQMSTRAGRLRTSNTSPPPHMPHIIILMSSLALYALICP
jgi:hypothetical protein